MTEAQRYPIPAARLQVEEEIERSRFITTLAPAPDEETAKAFIAELSEIYADANHNCWAYVIGPPGSTARVGMSDDGEPHGTAGRPMLNVLLYSDVGDVVVVVTRYFGGKKLGKGGLARAYSGGVKLALDSLDREEKVEKATLHLTVDYAAVTLLKRMMPEHEVEVLEEAFDQDANFTVQLPIERVEGFEAAVTSLTNGAALIETR